MLHSQRLSGMGASPLQIQDIVKVFEIYGVDDPEDLQDYFDIMIRLDRAVLKWHRSKDKK